MEEVFRVFPCGKTYVLSFGETSPVLSHRIHELRHATRIAHRISPVVSRREHQCVIRITHDLGS